MKDAYPFTLVRELLRSADFGQMQRESFRHYHARDMHYLCLHRSPELHLVKSQTTSAFATDCECFR